MSSITCLNCTNSSYTLTYGKYLDFNIWVMIFVAILALIIISRYFIGKNDDVGSFLTSAMSIVFALALVYGSLSVAYFDYTTGAINTVSVLENNTTTNYTYTHVFPVQKVIASNYLTIISIVVVIITILNGVDIIIRMLERPDETQVKQRGRGLRLR